LRGSRCKAREFRWTLGIYLCFQPLSGVFSLSANWSLDSSNRGLGLDNL
jgi:hypothetical protein